MLLVKSIPSFLALVLVMSIEAAPKKAQCQTPCDFDYKPICAKPAESKGTEITFGNKCVLDNYNCEKKDTRKFASRFISKKKL